MTQESDKMQNSAPALAIPFRMCGSTDGQLPVPLKSREFRLRPHRAEIGAFHSALGHFHSERFRAPGFGGEIFKVLPSRIHRTNLGELWAPRPGRVWKFQAMNPARSWNRDEFAPRLHRCLWLYNAVRGIHFRTGKPFPGLPLSPAAAGPAYNSHEPSRRPGAQRALRARKARRDL